MLWRLIKFIRHLGYYLFDRTEIFMSPEWRIEALYDKKGDRR